MRIGEETKKRGRKNYMRKKKYRQSRIGVRCGGGLNFCVRAPGGQQVVRQHNTRVDCKQTARILRLWSTRAREGGNAPESGLRQKKKCIEKTTVGRKRKKGKGCVFVKWRGRRGEAPSVPVRSGSPCNPVQTCLQRTAGRCPAWTEPPSRCRTWAALLDSRIGQEHRLATRPTRPRRARPHLCRSSGSASQTPSSSARPRFQAPGGACPPMLPAHRPIQTS